MLCAMEGRCGDGYGVGGGVVEGSAIHVFVCVNVCVHMYVGACDCRCACLREYG